MKTLLIPVDFTIVTENAVNFGAEWCNSYDYTRIILLNTFYTGIFDQISISAEYAPVSQDYMQKERQETKDKLAELSGRLKSLVSPDVSVLTATSEEPLLRAIAELIKEEKPDTLVLGSDNYNDSGSSIVAANLIGIAKTSSIRVLVVPVNYNYKPVQRALVPCDFNTLENLHTLNSLKTSPSWADVKLLALNVDPKERYLHPDEAFNESEHSLHQYLQNFDHDIFYSNEKNIINGIMNFTKSNEVQLIISMPGKHSFLYSLTHKSISQALYLNASEPILILK